MAKVRFTADFDYRPTRAIVFAYKAGMEMTVKRDCANKAIAAHKAVDLDPPKQVTHGEATRSR